VSAGFHIGSVIAASYEAALALAKHCKTPAAEPEAGFRFPYNQ
jgi:hypothetical protein